MQTQPVIQPTQAKPTLTAEQIRAKVTSSSAWAERAILALHQKQTVEEQMTERTRELNGVGFNGVDAEILTSFARQILAGRRLSEKQLAIAYRKLGKYAGQLERLQAGNN